MKTICWVKPWQRLNTDGKSNKTYKMPKNRQKHEFPAKSPQFAAFLIFRLRGWLMVILTDLEEVFMGKKDSPAASLFKIKKCWKTRQNWTFFRKNPKSPQKIDPKKVHNFSPILSYLKRSQRGIYGQKKDHWKWLVIKKFPKKWTHFWPFSQKIPPP